MLLSFAAAGLLASLAGAAALQATYNNPILFADYSDPDMIRVGRDYYLIASSFHFSPGIPILKSRDLVHWTIIGHVLPKLHFAPEYDMPGPHTLTDTISKPIGGTRYAGGVWAPSIRHHNGPVLRLLGDARTRACSWPPPRAPKARGARRSR